MSAADIDAEYRREPSGVALAHAAACRASVPDRDAKAAAWAQLVNDDTASGKVRSAIAAGFWRPDQEDLTAPYVERYAQDMPALAATLPTQAAEDVAGQAYPHVVVAPETLATMTVLAGRSDLTPALARALVNANDDMARSLAARLAAIASTLAG